MSYSNGDATGYSEDSAYCDNCGAELDPPSPCVCTFDHTVRPPTVRRYRVYRHGELHGTPFAGERPADTYARKFGGRLEFDGQVIARYPVPGWLKLVYMSASRQSGSVRIASGDRIDQMQRDFVEYSSWLAADSAATEVA